MTEKTKRFEIRLRDALAAAIDEWRKVQPDFPDRAEAARRLIKAGLSAHEERAPTKSALPPEQAKAIWDGAPSAGSPGSWANSGTVVPRFKSKPAAPKQVKPGGKLPLPPRR